MTKVSIAFEVESNSPWLEDVLENNNVLTDLAGRAVKEFIRDWKGMYTFATGVEVGGTLLAANVQRK